jgi:hypothetical protein
MERALNWTEFQSFYKGLGGRTECLHRSRKYEGYLYACMHNGDETGVMGTPVIYFPETWYQRMQRVMG